MQMHELTKEAENGRLLRLLAKINFIAERPGGVNDVVSHGPSRSKSYMCALRHVPSLYTQSQDGHKHTRMT